MAAWTNKTITTDTARPIITFRKSFAIIGKTLFTFLLYQVAIASSRPHNKPTNTQVVDIGTFDHSLNIMRMIAYTKSIIVADLTYDVEDFFETISCILPPPDLNI